MIDEIKKEQDLINKMFEEEGLTDEKGKTYKCC